MATSPVTPVCNTNNASDSPSENPSLTPSSQRNESLMQPPSTTVSVEGDVRTSASSNEPSSCLGKRKPIRPSSNAWLHFKKIDGDRAECNYCKKTYACDSKKNGTSNLNSHIADKCKKFPGRESKQKTLFFQPKKYGEDGDKLTARSYDPGFLRQQVTRYIVTCELPFLHVEDDGFRDFLRAFEPRFNVPSRNTTTRDVLQLYKTERANLRNTLVSDHQRVCLTIDTWTSIQNMNYMCITAHYIDSDWRYQKRIITFCQVDDHKGETIGKQIETCLLEWGIDKVMTVTVDNATANDVAISYLAKRVNNWKGSVMSNRYIHMRCSAHILNLVVNEGLKDYHESINRIRDVVRYWRGSPARMLKFKACAAREKITSKALLCVDVTTRWNSTYLMLEAAEKFQTVFDRLAEEDGQFVREFFRPSGSGESLTMKQTPTSANWEDARALIKFLKVFYDATLSFSGSSFATSNTFLWQLVMIHANLQIWISDKDNQFLRAMGEKIKRKYDKYWGSYEIMNQFLFVAILVDPRHKEHGLDWCFKQLCGASKGPELVAIVRHFLSDLYDEYRLLYPNTERVDFSQEQSSLDEVDTHSSGMTLSSAAIYSLYRQDTKAKVVGECKNEVDQYLIEDREPDLPSFDIFDFWKRKSEKYPLLSCIARDVLAIPVSTVASESTFSTGGRVLNEFRSSLSPTTVEALICTQNWLRSNKKIDILNLMQDTEEMEAEILGTSHSHATVALD